MTSSIVLLAIQDFRTFVAPILIDVETGVMDKLCNKTVVLEEDFRPIIHLTCLLWILSSSLRLKFDK